MSTAGLQLPPRYWARTLLADDAAVWQNLIEHYEEVQESDVSYYPEEFLEEVLDGKVDPWTDTRAVFHEDRLVGYAVVRNKTDGVDRQILTIEGLVDPRDHGRGIGGYLIDWSKRRVRERHRTVGHRRESAAVVWAPEQNASLRSLAEHHGFRATRWWYEITCRLDSTPALAVPELREGFELRVLRPADMVRLREAHNASFEDQREDGRVSPERWLEDFESDPLFRPDMSYLIVDGSQTIVSYVLTQENSWEEYGARVRELRINYLGTPPAWRGRGFFRHLTAAVDLRAREENFDYIGFTVDSKNPTGALKVFERANMFDWDRDDWECWIGYTSVLPQLTGLLR
ncbi:hypothetical protein ACWF94_05345 [Streptomyces sp. NPDC055078]